MTTPSRYRVWCLSWDEGDDDGADVIGYDIFKHDYNARTPRGVVSVADTVLRNPADAAKAYADYVHSQRDGHESSWPLTFRVRCSDGSMQDFEVDREYVPEFIASPIRTKVAQDQGA